MGTRATEITVVRLRCVFQANETAVPWQPGRWFHGQVDRVCGIRRSAMTATIAGAITPPLDQDEGYRSFQSVRRTMPTVDHLFIGVLRTLEPEGQCTGLFKEPVVRVQVRRCGRPSTRSLHDVAA